MGKLPGFIFYPGDWMKDPELRRCSKAAKGVWIDMIAVSFECADRGVFSTGGVPWTDREIAEAIGGDIAENLSCLQELLRKGVARRNISGAIFSARMVRDEQTRTKNRGRKQNQRDREKCHAPVPPSVTPLSVNENVSEVDIGVGSKDSASDVAAYVLEGLELNGRENRWLAEDAIKTAMRKFGDNAMQAAELIVGQWEKYRTHPGIEFKAGASKFLKESLFDELKWRISQPKKGRVESAIDAAFDAR